LQTTSYFLQLDLRLQIPETQIRNFHIAGKKHHQSLSDASKQREKAEKATNEDAQTGSKPRSRTDGARLHGHEFWLRSSWRQKGNDCPNYESEGSKYVELEDVQFDDRAEIEKWPSLN